MDVKGSIIISDDLPNGYNSRSRARILHHLYNTPELAPFYRLVNLAYGTPSEIKEIAPISSEEGVISSRETPWPCCSSRSQ
jgi:hypothetical protein